MSEYEDLALECSCMSPELKKVVDNALDGMRHGWAMSAKNLEDEGHDASTEREQAEGIQKARNLIHDIPECEPPQPHKLQRVEIRPGVIRYDSVKE